jgi:hypothetical protein
VPQGTAATGGLVDDRGACVLGDPGPPVRRGARQTGLVNRVHGTAAQVVLPAAQITAYDPDQQVEPDEVGHGHREEHELEPRFGNQEMLDVKASDVRRTPSLSPVWYTPVITMTSAVIMQMTTVSMNGSSRATKLSVTGRSVRTTPVGDGRRADPRLVAEGRALEAHDEDADEPARDGVRAEGAGEDRCEGLGDGLVVHGEDEEGGAGRGAPPTSTV